MDRSENIGSDFDASDDQSEAAGHSDLLSRPIVLAVGKSRDAREWKNESRWTAGQFLDGLEVADPNHHQKDGLGFLQGSTTVSPSQRTARAMDTMYIVGFDVESGEAPEPVAERAEQLGIEMLIYPTFNDMKPETRVPTDAVNRAAKIGHHAEATPEQVVAYVCEKKGFLPEIASSVRYVGRQNLEYVVAHDPLPRFRVVVVLKDPLKLTDLAPTFAGIKEKWASGIRALAVVLGIRHFDESCVDLSRLYYAHRRPKDAQHWFVRVTGKGVDFRALLMDADAQKPSGDAGIGQKTKEPGGGTYATPDLGKLLARCAKHFNAGDFILAHGEDAVDANGGVAARCPNEQRHSEEDPPGKRPLWAMNACDTEGGVFAIKCKHETCQRELKGGHYIDRICQVQNLTVDDLLTFVDEEGLAAWKGAQPDLESTQFSDPDSDLIDRLRAYNEKYAFVVWGKDHVIVKLNNGGQPIEVNRLATFYNRHKNDIALIPGRGGAKPREVAREWMKWRYRATYDGVGFSPANKLPSHVLNFWRGFAVAPAQGDWSHLLRHTFVVTCRENPVYFAAVMSWLADIIQRPEERHNTAVVTIGMPGSGKTTPPWFFSLLMPNNRALISKSHLLTGKFNSPLEHALFVHLEEAVWAGDREAEGVLKSLISEAYHMIERKGLDAQMVPNYARLWMNSNNEWVVPVRPGDRRFLVLRGLDTYATAVASDAERRAHFDPMYAQMQSQAGQAAMLYDLMHLRQPDWIDLRSPVKTPWLEEQRSATMEPHEAWLLHVLEEGVISQEAGSDFEFGEGGQPGLAVSKDTVRGSYRGFVRECRRGKGIDVGALGKYLAKFGVKTTRPRAGNQIRKRQYEFPPLDVIRQHFTAEYGVKFDVAASGDGEAIDVAGAQLSNAEFRDLSTDGINAAELDKWRAYGKAEGELP